MTQAQVLIHYPYRHLSCVHSFCFAQETFRSAVRPVSRPLALTLDNIDELPSDDTVGLLTGVQFVVPHERIRVSRVSSAVDVGVASDVEWRGAVKVVGGVVVNVRELLQLLLAH